MHLPWNHRIALFILETASEKAPNLNIHGLPFSCSFTKKKEGVACKKQLVQLPSQTRNQGISQNDHRVSVPSIHASLVPPISHTILKWCVFKGRDLIEFLVFCTLPRTPLCRTDVGFSPGAAIVEDKEYSLVPLPWFLLHHWCEQQHSERGK